jgi:hypothetical protein
MSSFLDGRRLALSGSRDRPRTDFLEFYWADLGIHHKTTRVYAWIFSLMCKIPWKIPFRLILIWLVCWTFLILFMAGIGIGYISLDSFGKRQGLTFSSVIFVLQYLFTNFLSAYVGDAARYFDPHPENVKFRNEVLIRGIAMLHNLHESKQYDRIIIVGHSLGSVIGYDLIRHFWGDYHEKNSKPDLKGTPGQIQLRNIEMAIQALNNSPNRPKRRDYKKVQALLWEEQKNVAGNEWLISDFITLCSPLAHAAFLIGADAADFTQRKNYGEYPTCPPVLENQKDLSYSRKFNLEEGQIRNINVIRDNAPFAVVAWVNLYFPGDLVGGPLIPIFGAGIRDEQVFTNTPRWHSQLWTSHTKYWKGRTLTEMDDEKLPKGNALRQLIIAMDLEFNRLKNAKAWMRKKVNPPKKKKDSKNENPQKQHD